MKTLFTDTYPITETALRWLENIISERFGNKWSLKRDIQGLHLKLIGTENEIIFDKINNDFTKTNFDIPCSWWNCEEQNWNSVLKKPMPTLLATILLWYSHFYELAVKGQKIRHPKLVNTSRKRWLRSKDTM